MPSHGLNTLTDDDDLLEQTLASLDISDQKKLERAQRRALEHSSKSYRAHLQVAPLTQLAPLRILRLRQDIPLSSAIGCPSDTSSGWAQWRCLWCYRRSRGYS